jgi:hypothetical protein
MRARVAKYPPRTTFHTASEGVFSEVGHERASPQVGRGVPAFEVRSGWLVGMNVFGD